jgi:transcriptional regulator with XRE-family HTH domain
MSVITIGERIKELRIEKGLFQQDLAEKLGVIQTCVSAYEKNRVRPSYEVLILLADIFEVSTDYLLGRTEY